MERRIQIAVPSSRDDPTIIYKQIEEFGPTFLVVPLSNIKDIIKYNRGVDSSTLVYNGKTTGGRTIFIRESRNPTVVTKYTLLSQRQVDTIYKSLSCNAIVAHVGGGSRNHMVWEITDTKQVLPLNEYIETIPCFLNK